MQQGTLQVDGCHVSDVDSGAAAFIDLFDRVGLGLGSSQSQLWILFREDFRECVNEERQYNQFIHWLYRQLYHQLHAVVFPTACSGSFVHVCWHIYTYSFIQYTMQCSNI